MDKRERMMMRGVTWQSDFNFLQRNASGLERSGPGTIDYRLLPAML
jgi:hypothetical protein